MEQENNIQEYIIIETEYYRLEANSKDEASDILLEHDYRNHIMFRSTKEVLTLDEWKQRNDKDKEQG